MTCFASQQGVVLLRRSSAAGLPGDIPSGILPRFGRLVKRTVALPHGVRIPRERIPSRPSFPPWRSWRDGSIWSFSPGSSGGCARSPQREHRKKNRHAEKSRRFLISHLRPPSKRFAAYACASFVKASAALVPFFRLATAFEIRLRRLVLERRLVHCPGLSRLVHRRPGGLDLVGRSAAGERQPDDENNGTPSTHGRFIAALLFIGFPLNTWTTDQRLRVKNSIN